MDTPPVGQPRRGVLFSPVAFVAIVAITLIVHMAWFIRAYAVDVFFSDQWDYLNAFFDHDPGLGELFFWQHGPHREGVGLLLDKFLYPLTAWDSRVDSFTILGCLIAATVLALILKRRLFGRLDYWDAIVPMLFLTLTDWEEITVTPNPAYGAFPLLLMMAYLVALTVANKWTKYGAVLALNFLLIYTGFGIFMGGITIAVFLLVCYRCWRGISSTPTGVAVAGLAASAASFASFFYHYRFQPAVDCYVFPYHPLSAYPEFFAILFPSFLGFRSGATSAMLVGAPIAIAAVCILAIEFRRTIRKDARLLFLTTAILVGYSVLFAANAAVGRVCLGLPKAAQAPRYAMLLIPAFLAIYLFLRSMQPNKVSLAALALLAVALLPGDVLVSAQANVFAERKREWVDCYRQREDIYACRAATHFDVMPYPEKTHLKEKLDRLKLLQLNLFSN